MEIIPTLRKCKQCDNYIPAFILVNNKKHKLYHRSRCLNCEPFKNYENKPKDRICPSCGKVVPVKVEMNGVWKFLGKRKYCFECSPFGKHNTKNMDPNGLDKRRRAHDKVVRWRQKAKVKALEYKGGCCIRCGYNRCVGALVFHHRDPEQKDFHIAGLSIAWDRMKLELDKCDLLCMNCHAEEHERLRNARVVQ